MNPAEILVKQADVLKCVQKVRDGLPLPTSNREAEHYQTRLGILDRVLQELRSQAAALPPVGAQEIQHVIVSAAIVYTDGLIVTAPRHFDRTMHRIIEALPAIYSAAAHTQGFVDQWGYFYNRAEAFLVAQKAGQIKKRVGGDDGRLFSENLY